ncbi:glutathione S-transferase Mu 1 isoform X2 [Pteropus medius]|uniref:glutathione S-transferase Mu 1 isoform X2 n=1 Tax=Pteropus vampyrus TaxID=132908 RepID=UPI00196B1D70|nr:glutathione S-transferase Mu 1 isoform X2 [Pteropus giganteus]
MRAGSRGAGWGTLASPSQRSSSSRRPDFGSRTLPPARLRKWTISSRLGTQTPGSGVSRAAISEAREIGWLTPSACSWSTQPPTMRRRSTRWGTLPYLIDGSHRLTQSNAILRYIARKHNLCGETEEEKIRVDILENEVMDISNQLARVCYSPDFEKLKPEYLKALPEKMKLFSQFLGKRSWFAADKLTYVDFLAYDILDLHRIFEPKCLDAFPNLKDFVARLEERQGSVMLAVERCAGA